MKFFSDVQLLNNSVTVSYPVTFQFCVLLIDCILYFVENILKSYCKGIVSTWDINQVSGFKFRLEIL